MHVVVSFLLRMPQSFAPCTIPPYSTRTKNSNTVTLQITIERTLRRTIPQANTILFIIFIITTTMTNRSNNNTNTSRLALIGLLSWWSSYQQRQQFVGGSKSISSSNGPSLQHRVKRSRRSVKYASSNINRRGAFASVVHSENNNVQSSSRLSYEDNNNDVVEWDLIREVHPGEDVFWVFDGSKQQQQQQQRESETLLEETADNDENRRRRKLWRFLYDQFVGVDELPPSDVSSENNELIDTTNTNNVTAEVEFEAIDYDGDDRGNNLIVNNNTTATTTTTIVNATNTTGNITESVVYTTTAENDDNSSNFKESDSSNISDDTDDDNDKNSSDYLLEEPQFQPLRMRAILAEDSGNGSHLNETERNILFHDMLSPALLAWCSSLRVDPVEGNLTVDVHQLLDGQTCGPGIDSGLPSIRVPLQHITDGIPDTDMIVYLSLGFSLPDDDKNETAYLSSSMYDGANNSSSNEEDANDGEENDDLYDTNSIVSKQEQSLGGGFGGRIKELHDGQQRRYLTTESNYYHPEEPLSASQTQTNGTTTSAINICTGNYLAAASYCSTDQYDRPTAALLHICIDETFFDIKYRRRNIMTLVHEIGHALGFNALSMAHFRKPDGTPYTPRNKDGDINDTTIECTGPGTDHQVATLALPSEEILRFRNVRGVRVAEIVTPSVVQVVRNQFDCQLLTGAELESGEGSPLSVTGEGGCIGDHWERRLFSSDVMNPIVDDIEYSTRISTLTLAYFADSGWYQVDLSNADVASGWGRGAGCNFVNDTCINEFGDVPPQNAPFFCNDNVNDLMPGLTSAQQIHGCTPDLSRKALCSIGQYDLELPSAYQYFNSTYGSNVGGRDTLMDFCPVYDGYDNGLCSSPESESVIKANDVERFGLRNSRCLVGNILPFHRKLALCLPIACVLEDRSLRVKVDEEWHICAEADQIIYSDSVNITCPDPRRICPTFFCPYDCLGTGGKCDYKSGQCLCEYKNGSNPEQDILDVCGYTVEEIKESKNSTSTTLRPILQSIKKKDAMPPPDTKISDYYVPDVLHLDDRNLMDAWGIAILTFTVMLLVAFFAAIFTLQKPMKEASAMVCYYLGFFRKRADDDIDDDDGDNFNGGVGSGSGSGSNTDKDKMLASVLVDMRINSEQNWRWRRSGRRDLNESIAETEDPSPPPSDAVSEPSSRQIENMSDSDLDSNTSRDDLPPEEPPQVIRRRRFNFVPNMFSRNK